MFQKLFSWLEPDAPGSGDADLEFLSVPLATSVLYFEIIRADDKLDAQEVEAFEKLVLEEFEALSGELKPLLKRVEDKAKEAVDFMQFTRLIHENCSLEEKRRILTSLWHLAAIDGHVDPDEEHLIRRISDLMYMDHSDFIQARLAALEKAG